jgi:hypothetical protein
MNPLQQKFPNKDAIQQHFQTQLRGIRLETILKLIPNEPKPNPDLFPMNIQTYFWVRVQPYEWMACGQLSNQMYFFYRARTIYLQKCVSELWLSPSFTNICTYGMGDEVMELYKYDCMYEKQSLQSLLESYTNEHVVWSSNATVFQPYLADVVERMKQCKEQLSSFT